MDVLIDIENEQDKVQFTAEHEELVKRVIKTALEAENVEYDCCVSVTLTDNDGIREINSKQRNIDRVTDVLSFPIADFKNGVMTSENAGDFFEDRLILGDIVLSLERAMEQSVEFGHSLEREIGYLVCHSVLHLVGYDHENEDERAVMRCKEEKTLEELSVTR